MGFDTKETIIDKLNELKANCEEVLNGIETMLSSYEASVLLEDGELTDSEEDFLYALEEFDEPLNSMLEHLPVAKISCDTAVFENDFADDEDDFFGI